MTHNKNIDFNFDWSINNGKRVAHRLSACPSSISASALSHVLPWSIAFRLGAKMLSAVNESICIIALRLKKTVTQPSIAGAYHFLWVSQISSHIVVVTVPTRKTLILRYACALDPKSEMLSIFLMPPHSLTPHWSRSFHLHTVLGSHFDSISISIHK